jgi:AraC family transcriptional regulator
VPADLSHRVAWERADFVLLQLDPDLIAESATEVTDGSPVEITPQLKLRDPLIEQILLALKHEAETGGGGGRLYAEALVTALCIRLIKHVADLPQRPRAAGRWQRLTADYMAEYIEANLAGDLTLSELACLVEMGRHQFGQAFKATFGRPPHQYVLARRLERARRLLIGTDMSITAIAYAAGFSSHSHLTTTFRRLHGLTPRSYRRSR